MNADVLTLIEKTWGFRSLRPLQDKAIQAVLDGRDSLVVLPTGGGKSLCYQAPAVYRGDTTVVVSPLISLMKDQVDSLRACGVPAIQFDSSQSHVERSSYEMDLIQGALRLLFVSPERLVQDGCQRLLRQINVKTFAIDEAHCISHWGHDFRPEYRMMAQLRERFPDAALHAYTATATERVRHDIVQQLGLRNPEVLVGDFDRPNLTYRVHERRELVDQVLEILARHKDQAGIIYCIRRKDVDELCASLRANGYEPQPYHAGLSPEQRKATQDDFSNERCDLVVATVAFGMGIDRSNLRFVLHAGMPKSIEHYQQEAGRAGRDGLPAECTLLCSPKDVRTWKFLIEKSAEEGNAPPEYVQSAMTHLNQIQRYCDGNSCRHRSLVEYFGQKFERDNCAACDACLAELQVDADSTLTAQKILSCVARVNEGYGIGYVIAVLRGEADERMTRLGHDKLSTFGLLRDTPYPQLRDWILQLLGQKLLEQTDGEYPILKLNAASWEVMRSQRQARLLSRRRRERRPRKRSASAGGSWQPAPRPARPTTPVTRPTTGSSVFEDPLFDALRQLRRDLARAQQIPPYIIFTDVTLHEMARVRPKTRAELLTITGVGEARLARYGDQFLETIRLFV